MHRARDFEDSLILSTAICLILIISSGLSEGIDTAPDFTLVNLEGQKVTLSSYKGKVVVLNFWGTWCEPCKSEMPSLNAFYLEYRGKGLVVLAVSIDQSEEAVKSFIAQTGYSFPVLLDNQREVYFDTYGLFGLPISVIIGRNGTIFQKVIGEAAWDSPQMADKMRKLLEGR